MVPPLRVARYREGGERVDVQAHRRFDGSLCIELPSESFVSCDVLPVTGKAIRLTYASWIHLDTACCRFAIFLVGTVSADVHAVRVDLGSGRWVDARIVPLPAMLDPRSRVFLLDRPAGFESLNRRLPVTALDDGDREIGRTHYLVQGG